jgi:hypothetical protein
MSPSRPLLSVVVPAYNEIEALPELYRQLIMEFKNLTRSLTSFTPETCHPGRLCS